MKNAKWVTVSLVLVSLVTTAQRPAFAGASAEQGTAQSIVVDKNASGTKLSGPVTLSFHDVWTSGGTCGSTESATMSFVLRLRKGSTLYAFSGEALSSVGDPARICLGVPSIAQWYLEQFLQTRVLPAIFPGGWKSYALKSVAQLVYVMDQADLTQLNDAVFDVELAVVE